MNWIPKTFHVVHQISAERARWERGAEDLDFPERREPGSSRQGSGHYKQFYGELGDLS